MSDRDPLDEPARDPTQPLVLVLFCIVSILLVVTSLALAVRAIL